MEYLNHIALNSGHHSKIYPEEISKDSYFTLRGLFKKSLCRDGIGIMDGYIMKSTESGIGYLITLFGILNGSKAPIFTIGCSKNDTGELWRLLHEDSPLPLNSKATDQIMLPYVADKLEIAMPLFVDALKWTDDFSRYMGWICLAPDKVR